MENDGLRRRTLIALAALALLAGACGGGTTATGGADASDAAEDLSGDLTVFAASSLTDAFNDLAASFSEQYPDVEGAFNFAGSQTLAGQIAQGAPADVFASADQTQMDVVTDAGLAAGEPEVFISNVLEIAVEPGNPLGITGLEDLAKPDLVVVLAAPEVPAGQYAAEALANAGVDVTPASLEVDVRSVLSMVALGEADAGIVYRSDIVAGGDGVEGVKIPEDQNVRASYPIVTLANAPNPAAAAFVDYVLSEEGQTTLVEYGFTAP